MNECGYDITGYASLSNKIIMYTTDNLQMCPVLFTVTEHMHI